jgi:hypothetical protein
LDIETPGNLFDLFADHGLMGKFPLEAANQHRNRGVASGLQSFAHLLKLHSSSAPSKPDRDRRRVVTAAESEFLP